MDKYYVCVSWIPRAYVNHAGIPQDVQTGFLVAWNEDHYQQVNVWGQWEATNFSATKEEVEESHNWLPCKLPITLPVERNT